MKKRMILGVMTVAVLVTGLVLINTKENTGVVRGWADSDELVRNAVLYRKELDTSVCNVYEDRKGILTVVSDDGYIGTTASLDEFFGARGLKCTIAGPVKTVDPYKDDWNYILEKGNIELVSHSYDHIKMDPEDEIANDEEALKHEILDADTYLEQVFGKKQIVFVCPENRMCDKGYEILENNDFWAVRRGTRGYNSLDPKDGREPGDWFNLMSFGIMDKDADLAKRNEWVDTAIDTNQWAIEMWHCVYDKDDGRYQTVLCKDAIDHLNYIKERQDDGSLWVATLTDATKYIRERQNSSVHSYISDNIIHVKAELTDPRMDPSTFDHPLTVRIKADDTMLAMINDQKEGISIEQTEEGTFILVNVVPNGEEVLINLNID